jgi:hypothetical protein
MIYPRFTLVVLVLLTLLLPWPGQLLHAQEASPSASPSGEPPAITAEIGDARQTLVDKQLTFDTSASTIPPELEVREIVWDFGDGVRTTGEKVSHTYAAAGSYTVRLTIVTPDKRMEDTTEVQVFDNIIILLTDSTISEEQLALKSREAEQEGVLLLILKARGSGPEALIEEELTQALAAARAEISRTHLIVTWTSGAIGPNVLSRFAQTIRQTDELSLTTLDLESKGIIILSDAAFSVLSPAAQSTFDQLRPGYVVLTRADALPLLFTTKTSEEARTAIIDAPLDYRLFGSFSSRAISDLGLTNFMSFGINYLINGGVPINNIILILMIPIIATLLAFARQVIGIKAFGLITPAMTTLSFLVMGLYAGLIVFIVVLLSGSLTRVLLKKLRLLYLPRMALVLTSASLAILVMLGLGTAFDNTFTLSFSIFPILILAILAEEFIAVQFTRGLRTALRITAWTLVLAIVCYFIMSWQLLRIALLSYPELVLLTIPFNIALGRFTGLRLVEYVRFRELLRPAKPTP